MLINKEISGSHHFQDKTPPRLRMTNVLRDTELYGLGVKKGSYCLHILPRLWHSISVIEIDRIFRKIEAQTFQMGYKEFSEF